MQYAESEIEPSNQHLKRYFVGVFSPQNVSKPGDRNFQLFAQFQLGGFYYLKRKKRSHKMSHAGSCFWNGA